MSEYKWDNPQEWLREKINDSEDFIYLRRILNTVIGLLDSDQIQVSFLSEMKTDGYFKPFESEVFVDSQGIKLEKGQQVQFLSGGSMWCWLYEGEQNKSDYVTIAPGSIATVVEVDAEDIGLVVNGIEGQVNYDGQSTKTDLLIVS